MSIFAPGKLMYCKLNLLSKHFSLFDSFIHSVFGEEWGCVIHPLHIPYRSNRLGLEIDAGGGGVVKKEE